MRPHELRLAKEHARASHHLRNLKAFIMDSSRFMRLDLSQQSLIREQAVDLENYICILVKRMNYLNIPV